MSAGVCAWNSTLGSQNRREEQQASNDCSAQAEVAARSLADIAQTSRGLVSYGLPPSHGLDDIDALIAATAEHHGLRLATLNVKHFPMFPKLRRAY